MLISWPISQYTAKIRLQENWIQTTLFIFVTFKVSQINFQDWRIFKICDFILLLKQKYEKC